MLLNPNFAFIIAVILLIEDVVTIKDHENKKNTYLCHRKCSETINFKALRYISTGSIVSSLLKTRYTFQLTGMSSNLN